MRVQNDGKSDIMKILSEINTTLNKLDNIEKDSISLTHGLPMDYPTWPTLKFVATINLTIPKNYGTLAV